MTGVESLAQARKDEFKVDVPTSSVRPKRDAKNANLFQPSVTRSMLGFKSFRAVAKVLTGIKLMRMIREGQMVRKGCDGMSYANQSYAFAGEIRPA